MLERLRIGAIPVLAAHAGSPRDAARRGTLLVYHPLGGDKSLHEADLEALARAGYLGVGVDAIAHGERRSAEATRRFREDPFAVLAEVVTATAAEVPGLVDALVARGWASPDRLGVAGVSLGGLVALGARTLDRRLGVVIAITATPEWGDDPRSPHLHLDAFYPAALLTVNAAHDPVIPGEPARALHAALAPRYAAAPERLRHVELAGERHRLSPAGEARARDEALRWVERFLGAPPAR